MDVEQNPKGLGVVGLAACMLVGQSLQLPSRKDARHQRPLRAHISQQRFERCLFSEPVGERDIETYFPPVDKVVRKGACTFGLEHGLACPAVAHLLSGTYCL